MNRHRLSLQRRQIGEILKIRRWVFLHQHNLREVIVRLGVMVIAIVPGFIAMVAMSRVAVAVVVVVRFAPTFMAVMGFRMGEPRGHRLLRPFMACRIMKERATQTDD